MFSFRTGLPNKKPEQGPCQVACQTPRTYCNPFLVEASVTSAHNGRQAASSEIGKMLDKGCTRPLSVRTLDSLQQPVNNAEFVIARGRFQLTASTEAQDLQCRQAASLRPARAHGSSSLSLGKLVGINKINFTVAVCRGRDSCQSTSSSACMSINVRCLLTAVPTSRAAFFSAPSATCSTYLDPQCI